MATLLDKLVPIPSIFFIGKNGAPLDVVTGITKTVEELESKIAQVLERAGISSPSAPAPLNIPQQSTSSKCKLLAVVPNDNLILFKVQT